MSNCSTIGIGFRIGKLTVEAKTDGRKNGYNIWLCRCDCGNAIELDTRTLQRGTKLNCGCVLKVSEELVGKRFGHLVCVKPDPDDKNWLCRCDCGKTCHATAYALRTGRKTCCGCLNGPKPHVLLGKQFGWLTVEAYANKKDGMQQLQCVCRCGNRCEVSAADLIGKKTVDCGCGGASGAETEIPRKSVSSEQPMDTGRNDTGVNWNPANRRWIAKIGVDGKSIYLGCFAEYGDAIAARREAERKYGLCVPKGLRDDLVAVCWEGKDREKMDWDLGWRYLDPERDLFITTAFGQKLEKWMSKCEGAVFGISEVGRDLEMMYRQAELALEICRIRREKWVYYESRTENDRHALLEKRTVEAAERMNVMLDTYGESCTPVIARRILGVRAAAIREMLQDGRLQKTECGISVRSVSEYLENENMMTMDLWYIRLGKIKRAELKEMRNALSQSIAVKRGRYRPDDYIVMQRLLERVREMGSITRNVVTGASHGEKTTEYTLCRNNGKLQIWEKSIAKRKTGEERQATILHTDARDILNIVHGYFDDLFD